MENENLIKLKLGHDRCTDNNMDWLYLNFIGLITDFSKGFLLLMHRGSQLEAVTQTNEKDIQWQGYGCVRF